MLLGGTGGIVVWFACCWSAGVTTSANDKEASRQEAKAKREKAEGIGGAASRGGRPNLSVRGDNPKGGGDLMV